MPRGPAHSARRPGASISFQTRHLRTHAICSNDHTRAPHTRADETPCRRSARATASPSAPGRRSCNAASAHRFAHRSKHLQRPARSLPLHEKIFAWLASRLRPNSPHVFADHEKIDRAVDLIARSPARVTGEHCCTCIPAEMSEGAMECMQGSEVGRRAHCVSRANGASRTRSHRPHPRQPPRRVALAAVAALIGEGVHTRNL